MNSKLHTPALSSGINEGTIHGPTPSFLGIPLRTKSLDALMKKLAHAAKTEADPIEFAGRTAALLIKRHQITPDD